MWTLFRATGFSLLHGGELFDAASALILLNIVGGIASTIFLFLAFRIIAKSPAVAALATFAFISTNAVINYSQTGCAYMMGIGFQAAGFYLICRAMRDQRFTSLRALATGGLLGLSIAVWFPYVLPMVGILYFALQWDDSAERPDWRVRLPFVLQIGAGIALVVGLTYAAIMAGGHITTLAAAKQWMARSRYGIQPGNGLFRMIGSLPRGFLNLGRGPTLLKQAILHPGSPGAGPMDALRAGVWKIVLIYAILLATVIALWRSGGRQLLVALALAALPVMYFAAFLFDPSPAERHLAVFPLLFCALAFLGSRSKATFARVGIGAFALGMLAINGAAMWRFNSNGSLDLAKQRLEAVNSRLGPQDRIFVLWSTEPISRFVEQRPFDSASRSRYQLVQLIEMGNVRLPFWKQDAAHTMMATWDSGGRAWLTRQALESAPKLEWGWVEGDDPRVSWREIPEFFRTLRTWANPSGGQKALWKSFLRRRM